MQVEGDRKASIKYGIAVRYAFGVFVFSDINFCVEVEFCQDHRQLDLLFRIRFVWALKSGIMFRSSVSINVKSSERLYSGDRTKPTIHFR